MLVNRDRAIETDHLGKLGVIEAAGDYKIETLKQPTNSNRDSIGPTILKRPFFKFLESRIGGKGGFESVGGERPILHAPIKSTGREKRDDRPFNREAKSDEEIENTRMIGLLGFLWGRKEGRERKRAKGSLI